jgi:leucyl-tRNA synthetase
MVLSTEAARLETLPASLWSVLVRLVAPYAPHLAEELWAAMGKSGSVSKAAWPAYDPALCEDDEDTIVVQVNGKLRGDFKAAKGAPKDALEAAARAVPKVAEHLSGKDVAKVIVVPGKLVNFVVKG